MTMITIDSELASNVVMAVTSVTLVFGYFFYSILSKTLDHYFSTEKNNQFASIFRHNRGWISNSFSQICRYNIFATILPKFVELANAGFDMIKSRKVAQEPVVVNNPAFDQLFGVRPADTFVECPCPFAIYPDDKAPDAELTKPLWYERKKQRSKKLCNKRKSTFDFTRKSRQRLNKKVADDVFENEINNVAEPAKNMTAEKMLPIISQLFSNAATSSTKSETANTLGLVSQLFDTFSKKKDDVPTDPQNTKNAISNLFSKHSAKQTSLSDSPSNSDGETKQISPFEMASLFDRPTRIFDFEQYESLTMDEADRQFCEMANILGLDPSKDVATYNFDKFRMPNDMVGDFIRICYFRFFGKNEFLRQFENFILRSKSNDVILTECLDDLD